ncbi:hypothetical protein F5144DRAFT_365342 [Chaetomium tenue]|uniref:Uncharacterized protein n=1 Tax=Chaetomium tenue TaxID=1854479 RepID=A0ACB7P2L8_9PEZI|nr:hypothetical protein F5144DRAFT_365342 [Chaetomium globosum]
MASGISRRHRRIRFRDTTWFCDTLRIPRSAMETSEGFPFLDLPGEVRNVIYEALLVMPSPIPIQYDGFLEKLLTQSSPRPCVALLCANKQIRYEAGSILYMDNTFKLQNYTSSPPSLSRFLDCIGSVNASYLKKLAVDFLYVGNTTHQAGETARFEDLRALWRCTNLKSLQTTTYGS